jgi:hypothetical protein
MVLAAARWRGGDKGYSIIHASAWIDPQSRFNTVEAHTWSLKHPGIAST